MCIHVHMYAYLIKRQKANSLENITWSKLWKQNLQAYFFFLFLPFNSLNNKDSDFELSEELSDADNESDDQDDSDFNETEVKKKSKGRGHGKSTSSPARPGVKPRTSVTGL